MLVKLTQSESVSAREKENKASIFFVFLNYSLKKHAIEKLAKKKKRREHTIHGHRMKKREREKKIQSEYFKIN